MHINIHNYLMNFYPTFHHIGFKLVSCYFMLSMYKISEAKYEQNQHIIKKLDNIEYLLNNKNK